jgi:hypothetical protein
LDGFAAVMKKAEYRPGCAPPHLLSPEGRARVKRLGLVWHDRGYNSYYTRG